MSPLEVFTWFVVIPVTFYVVVAVLVYVPSWMRSPKYRPGLSWWAEPVWIGGPVERIADAAPVTEGGRCSASW